MIYIGTILYGYCNGYFGRDSYDDKRIEAVGSDWVVVREENGMPNFASFSSTEEMEGFIKEWSKKEEEEENVARMIRVIP